MTVSISNLNFTWANSSNIFTAIGANVNASSYNANSRILRFRVNSNTVFDVDAAGNMTSKNLTADIITSNTTTSNTITANLVSANIISSNTVSDVKGDVRDLPLNIKSVSYILALSDTGKVVSSTANVTVPNTVFSSGQAITIYNNSASSITITQASSVTMYLAGSATTGNRTLAQRGVATILNIAANTFVVTGVGLS